MVVDDCGTVVAAVDVAVDVALATSGPEGDKLVKPMELKVMELNVVFRSIAVPVLMLAAVLMDVVEVVTFIELVEFALAVAAAVVEYAMLEEPVPPTSENRPE